MPIEKHAIIEFYSEPQEDARATAEQGRPIYVEREMVHIRLVGDNTRDLRAYAHEKFMLAPMGDGRVHLSYAERYPDHYAAFKAKKVSFEAGTPLEMLPFLSKARIAEFKVKHILTVENLVNLPDRLIAENGPGTRGEIKLATAWLDQAAQANLVAQANAREQELLGRLAALEAKLAAKEANAATDPADPATWPDDDLRAFMAARDIPVRANASREKLVAAVRDILADAEAA